jgi:RHS repeat-associated protein
MKTYGYTPNSTWSTDPIFCHSREGGNPEFYFYHNDHLGTPQKMTNISGAVVWSATYDAFGKATVDGSSSVTNNLRFPGQYFDQETGLHYNWFRFYDSSTGRYATEDPIEFEGGDVNFYSYVSNSPINKYDPTGEIQACKRRFAFVPIMYLLPPRHCYVILDSKQTLSYDNTGTHSDPVPNTWFKKCYPVKPITNPLEPSCKPKCNDDCIKKAMQKCAQKKWTLMDNNCCDCVWDAMNSCDCSVDLVATTPTW